MDELTADDFFNLLEDCGKAFGFVLSAALAESTAKGQPFSPRTFAGSLHELCTQERFSPNVHLVVGGIVEGMLRHTQLNNLLQGEDPLNPTVFV
jgi:hypothetical protein